jgi:hypothetical protein
MKVVGGLMQMLGVGVLFRRPAIVMAVAVAAHCRGRRFMVEDCMRVTAGRSMRGYVAEGREQQGQRHRQGDDEGKMPAVLSV